MSENFHGLTITIIDCLRLGVSASSFPGVLRRGLHPVVNARVVTSVVAVVARSASGLNWAACYAA